jgi:hypothetical protein
MDPDATYRLMVDESNDLDERAVAATDLLAWMVNAGAGIGPATSVAGNAAWRRYDPDECKYHIFRALDRLAELEAK